MMNNLTSRFSQNQRLLIVGISGFVAGAALTSIGFLTQPDAVTNTAQVSDAMRSETANQTGDTTATAVATAVSPGGDRVSVTDQSAGSAVTVSSVTLAASSWIAIHERAADGNAGNVLGAARLDQGTSSAVVTLLRPTVPGSEYFVRVYRDDGDREFNLDSDRLLIGADGAPVGDTFSTS